MSAGRGRREWGWHPLTDSSAQRVVDASPVRPGDLVLDLGAGTGALTGPLLDLGARVVAVELHPGRAAALRDRFGSEVTVVRRDVRAIRLPRQRFRVVANPPYAGSTGLLWDLLGSDRLLSVDMVLQAGVARDFVRRPRGRHARLFRVELGPAVPRSAFARRPRVDSRLLLVRRR